MRSIGIVTVGRSDYSIYLPILRRIQEEPELTLHLIVSGMHLSPEFGLTVKTIEADGFPIGDRVAMLLCSDSPEGIVKSMGLGMIGFAQAYARFHPDILVVVGDRFEMYAGALAALPFKIPVAHIHGGEVTQGVFDDPLRHSMTKLSHLHFVATEQYARRVMQLGEAPWRVIVTGAPSLDNLRSLRLLTVDELEAKHGLRLNQPPLLVTFHPVTLEHEQTEWQVDELLAALEACGLPTIFTMPNADTSNRVVSRMIEDFVESHCSARFIDNLGMQAYFSLMSLAAAMVGNSSSGIIEASSFKLPVVNTGTRQQGRIRAKNVIDVGYGQNEVITGIRKAISREFRASLDGLTNPYGDGHAAEIIVKHLKATSLDHRLLVKRFEDLPVSSPHGAYAQT